MKVSIGAVIDCCTGRMETAEKVSVREIKCQDRRERERERGGSLTPSDSPYSAVCSMQSSKDTMSIKL